METSPGAGEWWATAVPGGCPGTGRAPPPPTRPAAGTTRGAGAREFISLQSTSAAIYRHGYFWTFLTFPLGVLFHQELNAGAALGGGSSRRSPSGTQRCPDPRLVPAGLCTAPSCPLSPRGRLLSNHQYLSEWHRVLLRNARGRAGSGPAAESRRGAPTATPKGQNSTVVPAPTAPHHLLPERIAAPRCGIEIKAAVRQFPDLAPAKYRGDRVTLPGRPTGKRHPRCLSCPRRTGTRTNTQSKCNPSPAHPCESWREKRGAMPRSPPETELRTPKLTAQRSRLPSPAPSLISQSIVAIYERKNQSAA